MLDDDCGMLLSVFEDDEADDFDEAADEVVEVVDAVEAGGSGNVLTVDPAVFGGVLFSPQPVRLITAAAQIIAADIPFFML